MATAEQLRREGKAEWKAETLLRLLRLKFGRLSKDVQSRVRSADVRMLDRWTAAILTAPSIEEALH